MKPFLRLLSLAVLTSFAFAQQAPPTAAQQSPSTEQKSPAKTSKPGKKGSDSDVPPSQTAKGKAEDRQKQPTSDQKSQAKGEKKTSDPLTSSDTYSGLKLRSIGPAIISGRVIAFAVNPRNRANYYVAVASGGVWRTDNDGATWDPVFEHQGSYSIGEVKLDPKNPSTVWVGTGESNSQRSVGYGDGVYKSDDGGKSWKNVGLKHSEHIGRIAISPKDSNTVFVAAEGPLWAPGGDRGLYRTTDGGKSWQKVLNISENTGVVDVAIDPEDPNIMYAAAYQRRRHVWTLIDGGPEGGLYKSTDAGNTWTKLRSGLPAGDIGRIGIAISPADPNTVYATVEGQEGKGGIFRSQDKGATWERRNPFDDGAMYYAQITADPKLVDRIYIMNVIIRVSDDGGKTLRTLNTRNKHVDNHVLWIDPTDNKYFLVGCDGGVYETFDSGDHWYHKQNLSVAQFYDVAVDNAKPFYYVYGGTQDNNSLGGPSRTQNVSGPTNADWFVTQGGDGFHSAVDPEDPNTVYAEYQYGNLTRYDRRTGTRIGIQPQPGADNVPLRWNWDSPIVVSPHKHTRIYFAANRVFKSEDRGDTWQAISGDLSRQIDRDKLPVMGKIWPPDAIAKNASTSFYGNIVALAESPRHEGTIYVGTDDGLIQVTNNTGQSWTKYDKFPGVPENTFVSRILASQHDDNTVYASFDNHKMGDFKPYLLKSTDGGKSWSSIASNLPDNGPVLAIAEDTVKPNLLFAGTEFGAFFSLDDGGHWTQLKGNMPTIPVRDIVIHKGQNDAVMATFGRGFYILDDITPLRAMSASVTQAGATLWPARDALLYVEQRNYGTRKGSQGDGFFTADNPPFGATFTYFLKDKFKSMKEERTGEGGGRGGRGGAAAEASDADNKNSDKNSAASEDKKQEKGSKGKAKDGKESAEAKNEGEKPGAAVDTTPAPVPFPAISNAPYPTMEQLREEAEEEAPSVYLTILDASGKPVRRVRAQNAAGLQRVTWDLRYPESTINLREGAGAFGDFEPEFTRGGPLVMPGEYKAVLSSKVRGEYKDLTQPVAFRVTPLNGGPANAQDAQALEQFQQKLAKIDRALAGVVNTTQDVERRLRLIQTSLRETPGDVTALMKTADELEKRNNEIQRAVTGDRISRRRQENTPVAINDRVEQIMDEERLSTSAPTQTHIQSYEVASKQFTEQLGKLKQLVDVDLKNLEDAMEKAGAPWTPGHLPTYSEQ